MTDMAILAITPANLISRSNHSNPYRSCGSLRDRLEFEGRLTFRCKLFVDLVDQSLHQARIHVSGQFGLDRSGMHRRSPDAVLPMPLVKGDRKKDVCRL